MCFKDPRDTLAQHREAAGQCQSRHFNCPGLQSHHKTHLGVTTGISNKVTPSKIEPLGVLFLVKMRKLTCPFKNFPWQGVLNTSGGFLCGHTSTRVYFCCCFLALACHHIETLPVETLNILCDLDEFWLEHPSSLLVIVLSRSTRVSRHNVFFKKEISAACKLPLIPASSHFTVFHHVMSSSWSSSFSILLGHDVS